MRNLLKNKLFIVLLVFLLLIINCSGVFAYTLEELPAFETLASYDDIVSNYKYYVIVRTFNGGSYNYILLCTNKNNFVAYTSSAGNANIAVRKDSGNDYITSWGYITVYNYSSDGTWKKFTNSAYDGYCNVVTYMSPNGYDDVNSFCYSNADVYTTSGTVFFQQPPPIVEEPTVEIALTQTLVETATQVQIAEQLKMMIVGFLKYLIVLVISLLAFWKGWQFLSTQLRKA